MENSLVNALLGMESAESVHSISLEIIWPYLLHSLILGFILSVATFYITVYSMYPPLEDMTKINKVKSQALMGAANILFLCVGLTGVMILVNNNLARALAIGATMALMRFRVKLGQKNLSSNLLFGIIAGVSCGLQALQLAWALTILYLIMQFGLMMFLRRFRKKGNEIIS